MLLTLPGFVLGPQQDLWVIHRNRAHFSGVQFPDCTLMHMKYRGHSFLHSLGFSSGSSINAVLTHVIFSHTHLSLCHLIHISWFQLSHVDRITSSLTCSQRHPGFMIQPPRGDSPASPTGPLISLCSKPNSSPTSESFLLLIVSNWYQGRAFRSIVVSHPPSHVLLSSLAYPLCLCPLLYPNSSPCHLSARSL